MPRSLGLAVAVAALMSGDAAALASTQVVPRAEIARALAIGRRAFGPACSRGIAVRLRALPGPTAAAAVWRLAQASATRCRITLAAAVYRSPRWRAHWYSWPWLCTLLVHEYGHLTGRAHSRGRRSPMYPLIWRVWPPCRSANPRASG